MSNTPLPDRKMAPVQGWPQGIPWSLHLEAYAAYCKKWSPQPALIEGWCRGGFGTKELDEFIPGWRERASEIAQLRNELAHAAAVTAAKDAEIAGLRAELLKSLADNAALRERVRVLEDAHPEPDCRTCKRSAIQHGVTRCTSPYFCTNADHYEPLPPVRLWRTT